jgi:hypothetical protein
MHSWIRNVFARPVIRPYRKAPFRARPTLEVLEDRWVPSIVVNNPTDTPVANETDLRQAIDQANAAGGNQTITFDPVVFASAQTITLGGTQLELSDTTGTESIIGPAAGVTVSGNNASRVVKVDANITASISGMTITGGSGANYAYGGYGGGVSNYGSLTLSGCTVSGNSAGIGAGVCTGTFSNPGATTILTNCTVSGNTGGIGGTVGGLLNLYGTLYLTNCTVSGNSAAYSAGGLYNLGGTLSLTNCTVTGNSCSGRFFTVGGVSSYNGTATLVNTIVAGNTSGFGRPDVSGAFSSQGNNLIGVINHSSGWVASDLTGTAAHPLNPVLAPLSNYGGPTQTIAILPGSPALDAGASGPGIPANDQRGMGRVGAVDIGAFESQGFVMTAVPGSSPQTAVIGTAFANPLAVTVKANNPAEPVDGGIVTFANTSSHGAQAVLATPLAVIAGGVASCTAGPNNADGSYTVVASVPGLAPISFALTNIGPVLAQLVVNTTSASLFPGAGLLSLPEAIAFADLDSAGISSITFDPTVFATPQTINLTGTPLELSNTGEVETITGPAAGVTVNGGGLSRVFQVDANVTASLSGLTISGGSAVAGGGLANYGGTIALTNCTVSGSSVPTVGGGILNSGGTATLTDCTISGNASGGNGGGMYCYTGTATLIGCTISGNSDSGGRDFTVHYGGGGISTNSTNLTLTNCTVSDNSDPHGNGGGLETYRGTATVTGCTFTSNSSAFGGADEIVDGNQTLMNCSLTGNSVSVLGGGLQNFFGTLSMSNCNISDNSAKAAGGGLQVFGTTMLINCTISGNSADFGGGGLESSGKTTVTNCSISGNSAKNGGGVEIAGSNTTLTNCTIGGNSTTTGNGGGVWIAGRSTGTLTGCTISGNSAPNGNGGGVSIDLGSSATLTNCSISGNSALNGGGVFTTGRIGFRGAKYYGTTTLTNCVVTGNTAVTNGGGVDNTTLGKTTVTHSIVERNSANVGAGISNQGTLNVASSIILANQATSKGGGISTTGGSATFTDSTINGNFVFAPGSTALGGGIDCENSLITLTNCSVSVNQAYGATALGGGIYALNSTADIEQSTVLGNKANGTVLGEGGGIYSFNSILTLVNTLVKGNKATTAYDDIFNGP